jgi:uncharacterized protein YggE
LWNESTTNDGPSGSITVGVVSTEITVRGSYTAFQPPERATAYVAIAVDGPEMDPVYQRVAQALETVKTSISALHNPDSGPVTWWSNDQLRTWSNRPWNNKGEQVPLRHYASTGVQAKFRDFAVLSRWISQHVAAIDGLRIARIEWALTAEREQTLLAQVRHRAVQDALTRAQQYAQALGLDSVRPIAIADAGMLGPGLRPASTTQSAHVRAPAAAPNTEVEFTPKDVEVKAVIDARFAASTAENASS